MAEKSTTRKRTARARQQMKETVEQVEQQLAAQPAEPTPETRLQVRADQEAVAAAESLSTEGVVKSIADLKASINSTLMDLADRLEGEVARYAQIRRAVAAKDAELKEIYDIQRSATTLLALIEAQDLAREQMQRQLNDEKARLEAEVDELRAHRDREQAEHETEQKERDQAEQKRRQREQEEYRYSFAREQQQARDAFADESAKAEKALADRQAQADRSIQQREQELAGREQELQSLRQRVEQLPKELDAAVSKALAEARQRSVQEAKAREELLVKEFAGEKNVLLTRVSALEQTVTEQSERVARLQEQSERAYQQVQEIAIRAVEGSAQSKQLASLQQLLTDPARKPAAER